MRKVVHGWVLATVAGTAWSAAALGQDSVSTGNGLPGDAVSAYTIGASSEQVNDYVLDLTSFRSSWQGLYRTGPLMKGSSGGTSYFTTLIGPQAASSRFGQGPFLRTGYNAWSAAGAGINATRNSAPTEVVDTSTGVAQRLAVSMMEFAGGPDLTFGNGDDDNNIITSIVDFQLRYPSRLYVSRIMAAANRANFTLGALATGTFGLGGVDETGSTSVIADGFGMTSGSAVQDKRFYRLTPTARNTAVVNQLNNSGATDAGAARSLNTGNQTTLAAPTMLPTIAAGRPIVVGGDFNGNVLFEQAANSLTASTAYLPAGGSPRGPISLIAKPFARVANGVNDVATAAVFSRLAADTRTRGISVWGVNSDGSPDLNLRVVLPATVGGITDPTSGFDPIATFGSGATQEFTNFASQVSFRGGSGPVAMNTLYGSGDLMVAGVVAAVAASPSAVPAAMDNYLAVARVNVTTGAVTWTIAAHTGNASGAAGGLSKPILGRATANDPLAPIGRLARYNEVFPTATSGPSISSAAMDVRGNLYFLATVSLNQGGLTTGLIRAVYDGVNSYNLELLMKVGDVFAGANSALNYQVQFMGVSDADSVDSGAIWGGSMVHEPFRRVNLDNAPADSPLSLGALVVRAKIVYDRNSDAQYRDPTVSGNAGQPDQGYNVAMIVMPGYNPIDFNSDSYQNLDDLSDFITAFYEFPQTPNVDYNEDGVINLDDLSDYITDFYGG